MSEQLMDETDKQPEGIPKLLSPKPKQKKKPKKSKQKKYKKSAT